MRPILGSLLLLTTCALAIAEPEVNLIPLIESMNYAAPVQAQLEKRAATPYTQAQLDNTTTSTACADVHIIVDRATGEAPSQGVIGTLATLVTSRIKGANVEWINYPAVLMPYDQSTNTGYEMTTQAVKDYADKCKNAKIVMLGYSQGAQVVGDVLCGGGGDLGLGPVTDPLPDNYLKRVVAAVQMGDPRFMPNKPWDAGTSTFQGLFPRSSNNSCDRAAAILKSYCDQNDPFCSVPGFDYNLHASYDVRYNEDAFNFIQGKINGSTTGKKGDSSRQSPRSAAALALVMVLAYAFVL